jgi:hypothetical protein
MKWVVNCRREDFDIFIGRPSKYGNIYSHQYGTLARFKVASREEAIYCYEQWLYSQPELISTLCRELEGKILGCYCDPLACHGDVLARIANNVQLCLPLPDEVFKEL